MAAGLSPSAPAGEKKDDGGGLPSAMRMSPKVKGGLAKLGMKHGGLTVQRATKPVENSVLTIIVQGNKDAGKSCMPAGIPAKKGRKVVIACDDTTAESLMNYYGPSIFEEIELYEITRRVVDKDGTEIYPGYDPNRTESAEVVMGNLMLLLDELEQSGDVEVLFVDHFQALYEQVAVSLARHAAGLGPDDRMQMEHWSVRTQSMTQIENKIRRTPMPGGVAIISGYGAEEKVAYKDGPGGKKIVVRELQQPKWLKDDIRRNWLVTLGLKHIRESTEGGEQNDRYECEVLTSKTSRFPKGSIVDITEKSLGLFWDTGSYSGLEAAIGDGA